MFQEGVGLICPRRVRRVIRFSRRGEFPTSARGMKCAADLELRNGEKWLILCRYFFFLVGVLKSEIL